MAGHANVRKRRHLRFLVYMEAASVEINPMSPLERCMAADVLSND